MTTNGNGSELLDKGGLLTRRRKQCPETTPWSKFHNPLPTKQLWQLPPPIRAQFDNLQYLTVETLKNISFREGLDTSLQLKNMRDAVLEQQKRIGIVNHSSRTKIEEGQDENFMIELLHPNPKLEQPICPDTVRGLFDPPLKMYDQQMNIFDLKDAEHNQYTRYSDADEFLLLS